ncbi:MAG TPA: hypothetical protein VHP81_05260, partial [Lachnospiraceae bacterium]|nr:hypothetical protein [Lachnospiraceae bacterium]
FCVWRRGRWIRNSRFCRLGIRSNETVALSLSVKWNSLLAKYLPILRLFDDQKEITRVDVEEVLKSGVTHAINTLKEMLDKDLISKVGNGRLTRYVQK